MVKVKPLQKLQKPLNQRFFVVILCRGSTLGLGIPKLNTHTNHIFRNIAFLYSPCWLQKFLRSFDRVVLLKTSTKNGFLAVAARICSRYPPGVGVGSAAGETSVYSSIDPGV